MKILGFSAAIIGIMCLAFAAFGSALTLYTGDPIWQPLTLSTVIWAILTPIVASICWIIDHE